MKQIELFAEDKCTAGVVAQILGISERSAQRYIQKLRKALGVEPYQFVSIGAFCRHFFDKRGAEISEVILKHR